MEQLFKRSVRWARFGPFLAGFLLSGALILTFDSRPVFGPHSQLPNLSQRVPRFVVAAICIGIMLLALTQAVDYLRRKGGVCIVARLGVFCAGTTLAFACFAFGQLFHSEHGEQTVQIVRSWTHRDGRPGAPLQIIEFADFQCPYCGIEEPIISRLLREHGDDIDFSFRQFPLTEIHARAEDAAEASECAASQGRFWPMYQFLYEHQKDPRWQTIEDNLKNLGINADAFRTCMRLHEGKPNVTADADDGKLLGITGTPTIFVNGRRITGAKSYEIWVSALEKAKRGLSLTDADFEDTSATSR